MNRDIHLCLRTVFTIGLSKKCEKKTSWRFSRLFRHSRHLRTISSHELSQLSWNSHGLSQVKYTASKPKLENIDSVKIEKEGEIMFWKTHTHTHIHTYTHTQTHKHTHKKSSTVLNFFKESSFRVLEMISSELKSPEVSVPAKLCFVLTSRNRNNCFGKIFLSTSKQSTW